jgi:DNA repair protein RadA/Sms
VLLAGDPGIGKSTLLLQTSAAVASAGGGSVLYASGEESAEQIRMRAGRLGIEGTGLYLAATNRLEELLPQVEALKPNVIVVDSIQTLASEAVDSMPGSVSQVQSTALSLAELAKSSNTAVVMAGHVTKDGGIAGPRVLEHLVDAVLQLDGDPAGVVRTLHGVKNRFGATSEIGVFEMRGDGLVEVEDPSRVFLANRRAAAPGSAVVVLMEGSRPIAVEVQALTTPSLLPSPRRVATGIESSRLHLVLAVLARRLGLPVAQQDVIVNVPGGLRVREPAADLGLALALASSLRDVPVQATFAAAAEVGLGGELRPVVGGVRRAGDARRLGFSGCLLAPPSEARVALQEEEQGARHVASVGEAIELALAGGGGGARGARSRSTRAAAAGRD